MKSTYYENWKQEGHLTVFGKRLNDEQSELSDVKIFITDKDKLQL